MIKLPVGSKYSNFLLSLGLREGDYFILGQVNIFIGDISICSGRMCLIGYSSSCNSKVFLVDLLSLECIGSTTLGWENVHSAHLSFSFYPLCEGPSDGCIGIYVSSKNVYKYLVLPPDKLLYDCKHRVKDLSPDGLKMQELFKELCFINHLSHAHNLIRRDKELKEHKELIASMVNDLIKGLQQA